MFGLGPTELVIIFLVILLLFGGKKIPEIARGLGRGLKEFRSAREEKIRDSHESLGKSSQESNSFPNKDNSKSS